MATTAGIACFAFRKNGRQQATDTMAVSERLIIREPVGRVWIWLGWDSSEWISVWVDGSLSAGFDRSKQGPSFSVGRLMPTGGSALHSPVSPVGPNLDDSRK